MGPILRIGNRSKNTPPMRSRVATEGLWDGLPFGNGPMRQLLLYEFSEGSIAPVRYLRASGRGMAREAREALGALPCYLSIWISRARSL